MTAKKPSKPAGRMRRAVDRSIRAARDRGIVDLDLHAGPICALRILAEQMDDPEWPLVGGKLDNVSLPTMLRYCQALGVVINPDARRAAEPPAKREEPVDELAAYRARRNGTS